MTFHSQAIFKGWILPNEENKFSAIYSPKNLLCSRLNENRWTCSTPYESSCDADNSSSTAVASIMCTCCFFPKQYSQGRERHPSKLYIDVASHLHHGYLRSWQKMTRYCAHTHGPRVELKQSTCLNQFQSLLEGGGTPKHIEVFQLFVPPIASGTCASFYIASGILFQTYAAVLAKSNELCFLSYSETVLRLQVSFQYSFNLQCFEQIQCQSLTNHEWSWAEHKSIAGPYL